MTADPVEKIRTVEITPAVAAEMLAVLREIRATALRVHVRGAVVIEASVMRRVRAVLATAGEIGGVK